MHIETLIDNLACELADAVYQKYQREIYGLRDCQGCYNDDDIFIKTMLKDLLDNYSNSLCCDIDKIKDLH